MGERDTEMRGTAFHTRRGAQFLTFGSVVFGRRTHLLSKTTHDALKCLENKEIKVTGLGLIFFLVIFLLSLKTLKLFTLDDI